MVDDDADFLALVRELFVAAGGGKWEVFTATNHAQALELLQKERMDLVVLDIGMPIMDGFQFTRLLSRAHPGQNVAMLTGHVTEEKRKACQETGVLLLLEKPVAAEGFDALFAALASLADAQAHSGFRGMMRQVGLQEVLQMECLGRKSSVLEVFAGKVRGRIYISDGMIVHAEAGPVQGEAALYGLLALQGGEFNLGPFAEPAQRTISGPWEFLLMEAARLTDEGVQNLQLEGAEPPLAAAEASSVASQSGGETQILIRPDAASPPVPAAPTLFERASEEAGDTSFETGAPVVSPQVRIEEVALCSGSGEVLYEWECRPLEGRLKLLEHVEQEAAQLSKLITLGRFDRLEIVTAEARMICHLQPDRRLFVRSTTANAAAS